MTEVTRQPVVLSIAGFDPSGGAGVLADIKTFAAFDCFGVAAVTSLTFQNTKKVYGVVNQSVDSVLRQFEPLFDDFEISAIKTGMLPNAETIGAVAGFIRAHPVRVVVVDPVLRSTSGFELVDEPSVDAFKNELLPLASVVTPNVTEAERLVSARINSRQEIEHAAGMLLTMGAGAVLITGADSGSALATDLLMDHQGTEIFSEERIQSRNTHGTGCTFASAIACLLAHGRSLRESIPIAKRYVVQAIAAAPGLGCGDGPLNHFPPGFRFKR